MIDKINGASEQKAQDKTEAKLAGEKKDEDKVNGRDMLEAWKAERELAEGNAKHVDSPVAEGKGEVQTEGGGKFVVGVENGQRNRVGNPADDSNLDVFLALLLAGASAGGVSRYLKSRNRQSSYRR